MRSLKERYNFLVSRLKVEEVDRWEGDALLTMKSFCFGFPADDPHNLDDINAAIDFAIDTAESDARARTFIRDCNKQVI